MKHSRSAGGVVLNPKGLVLIVSQKGTSWSLPKGHIEAGESQLDAARREIREESGITLLELIRDLGSYQRYRISDDGLSEDKSDLKTIFMFLFRTNQNDLKPMDENNPEAKWLNKDKAVELLTHTKDKEFLRSVMDKLD